MEPLLEDKKITTSDRHLRNILPDNKVQQPSKLPGLLHTTEPQKQPPNSLLERRRAAGLIKKLPHTLDEIKRQKIQKK